MSASASERECYQSAYQLVVTSSEGKVMWDSKKVVDDKSLNIEYSGTPLQPTASYNWKVTVWDQNSTTASESSWLERS